MKWLGHLPNRLFSTARFLLNVASRLIDQFGHSRLSLYGWALAFDSLGSQATKERSFVNVCMHCGFAFGRDELPRAVLFYRCRICGELNPLFGPVFDKKQ